MKKIITIFLFFILSIFILKNTNAQTNSVLVNLRQPPPYQFHVEDMWKVTLTFTSDIPIKVYLYGKATSKTEGLIVDAKTATFSVGKGVTMVKANEIGPIDVNKQNGKYEDVVKKIGGVQTGFYEICVSCIDAATGQTLGFDCIEQEVQNFTQIELLLPETNTLITDEYLDVSNFSDTNKSAIQFLKFLDPYTLKKIKNAEQVLVGNGQFVVFNWMPPTPIPRGYNIRYTLKVVEIYSRQTGYDAMQSNPLYYVNSNIPVANFQYPLSARQLQSGKSYAWQVLAYVNGVLVSQSEIRDFIFVKTNGQLKNENMSTSRYKPFGNLFEFNNTKEYHKYMLEVMRSERLSGGINTGDNTAKEKGFMFTGAARLYGEYNDKLTPGTNLPKSFANLDLSPGISIYGIPFSTSIFLSTLGDNSLQNLNNFALFFDKNFLRQQIDNKISEAKQKVENKITEERQKLEQKLLEEKDKLEAKVYEEKEKTEKKLLKDKEDNLKNSVGDEKSFISAPLRFFSLFKSLGIGVNYPEYTKYSVSGVPVTGLDMEFNPGLFYVAFAGLGNQRAVQNQSYRRSMYTGRLGIGKIEKSNFIITGMYATDDANSMTLDSSALNSFLTPKSDYLFGLSGKLSLFKDIFTLEAEANGSLLTRDTRDAELGYGEIPDFVKNMFHPRVSSSVDYMYAIKSAFNNEKSDTKISFALSMIGPGYLSLGAPTVRNDKFGIEAKLDQKFAKKKISFSANFKTSKDNLILSKASTTRLTSAGINFGLNFTNYPFVRLSYTPYFQKNDREITTSDSSKIDNTTHIFSLCTGYSKNLGSLFSQTTLMFSLQDTKTLFGLYDANNYNIMLSQSFGFRFPLTLSGSVGYINSAYTGVLDSKIINADLSIGYTLFDVWTNSLGGSLANERDKSNKYGFFFNSTLTLWQKVNLDFRVEHNIYNENVLLPQNYDMSVARLTLSTNW